MSAFEERSARYLWTDAFAVCNDVALSRALGDARWLDRALELVERVHVSLGRHREDDARKGWLSGLDDVAGAEHPTRGGLRIGKKLPERAPHEPIDPRLEWDRDGQYFHYLTKWMHALDVLARERRDERLARFACELALVAYDAFTWDARGSGQRMYWKMSIDLSRPLVASMGHHDPLDGVVTYAQIRETSRTLGASYKSETPRLDRAIDSFCQMVGEHDLSTDDPLGLGGLLVDAYRLDQLAARGAFDRAGRLRDRILEDALAGLDAWTQGGDLELPSEHRLAFRELGLAIGLEAVARIPREGERFARYFAIGTRIVSFWSAPANPLGASFQEHRDIDEVMLATSLVPDGFLVLK